MRFLFVTNYFPPHYVGGYELHCERVARWLAGRGHSVGVLTGDFVREDAGVGLGDTSESGLDVWRLLRLRYWTDVTDAGYWLREWRDLRCFRATFRRFQPDVVVLWNMRKLASGIVMEAQRLAPALVHHLMDEWAGEFRDANGLPQFWARPARSAWGRAIKPRLRALHRMALTPDVSRWRPRRAALVSRALGELIARAGVKFEKTHVSFITFDPALFGEETFERPPERDGPIRMLWAGRLCEGKGLGTALRALDILHARRPEAEWTVDFCGPLDDETHQDIFGPRLREAPWRERARYLGALPHEEMPERYRAHEIFLFTSEVHEGLPGAIVEAFACSMAVVGTLTGGTRDVLRHEENCLTYPMGDAEALAGAVERLIDDADLRGRLSSAGARFAREFCANEAVFPKLLDFYADAMGER